MKGMTMFKMFENLTKAVVGAVFSPVSMAADLITLGGVLVDRDEPYTVSSLRQVMRNMDLAFDPDGLTDEQVRQLIAEIEKRK